MNKHFKTLKGHKKKKNYLTFHKIKTSEKFKKVKIVYVIEI